MAHVAHPYLTNSHLGRGLSATIRPLVALASWAQRIRERNQLAGLSDRDLKDIGINRVDVWREVSKPFWRD